MADSIYNPTQTVSDYWRDAMPFILEGQVVDTADPDQMGRVRIWVPALDGESYDSAQLPWAEYASPLAGFTVEYPAGEGTQENLSHAAYGLWMIPKIGATVFVFCKNGSPQERCYFACSTRLHRNRSLPAGRNADGFNKVGPWGDAGDGKGSLNPIQPAYNNLRAQFQNQMSASEAITRGGYERAVAQAKEDKDGSEGYSANPADPSYLDPQTYCLVTPGRHAIIMQDDPKFSRLRLKTAEGHQVILDDANERIYVSTSKGASWIEMDADGHVQIFGGSSLSMRAGVDINLFADGNINLEAGKSVNIKANKGDILTSASGNFGIKANGNIQASACGIFDLDCEKSLKITAAQGLDVYAGQTLQVTAASTMNLKGGSAINLGGGQINLNSASVPVAEKASCPPAPAGPSVVPGHEPWTRPVSTIKRGPNWRA